MDDTECYIPLENQFDEDDKLLPPVADTHIVTYFVELLKGQ